MPFSSGVFTFTSTTFAPTPTTLTVISSTAAATTWADIATALSTAVLKDGTQTATASVPFAQGIGVGTANAFAVSATGTITGTSTSTQVVSGPLNIAGASAGQIVFPATQNASANANTLDDYEEGTWTPVLSSAAGTITTVGTVIGKYTKIGNAVTITTNCTITTNGTGSGSLTITGLPFASAATYVTPVFGRENGVSGKSICGRITGGATQIDVIEFYDATYPGTDGSVMCISATYNV